MLSPARARYPRLAWLCEGRVARRGGRSSNEQGFGWAHVCGTREGAAAPPAPLLDCPLHTTPTAAVPVMRPWAGGSRSTSSCRSRVGMPPGAISASKLLRIRLKVLSNHRSSIEGAPPHRLPSPAHQVEGAAGLVAIQAPAEGPQSMHQGGGSSGSSSLWCNGSRSSSSGL